MPEGSCSVARGDLTVKARDDSIVMGGEEKKVNTRDGMMYNFKKFSSRNTKTDDRISIGAKSYSIGLPTPFVVDNGLRATKYAVLYFDPEKLAIGIQFTDDVGSDRFSLVHSKQGYGANIVCRSFFKVNHIEPGDYKKKYSWKKYFQDGVGDLFVIELEKISTNQADTSTEDAIANNTGKNEMGEKQ